MSLTTTPYASVSEADEYFDPLNHIYVTEWWAADVGSSAKARCVCIDGTWGLEIEAINPGVAGNLYHISIEKNPFEDVPAVSCGERGVVMMVAKDSGTSAAAMLALLEADEFFTPVLELRASLIELPGSQLLSEMPETYLTGGADPDAERLGQKAPALAFATRKINGLPFAGEKADPTQANAFPRKYLRADAYVGLLPTADAYYTETEVPDEVKMACCEEALAIMKYGNTPRYKMQKENVKSFAFGSQGLRETFTGRSNEGSMISGEAMNLLRKFMRRNYLMVG